MNDIGKIVKRCVNHPKKLDNCFLTEDYKHYCKYVGEEKTMEARNKFGIPYIQRYYLCNKPEREAIKLSHETDEEKIENPDYNI